MDPVVSGEELESRFAKDDAVFATDADAGDDIDAAFTTLVFSTMIVAPFPEVVGRSAVEDAEMTAPELASPTVVGAERCGEDPVGVEERLCLPTAPDACDDAAKGPAVDADMFLMGGAP